MQNCMNKGIPIGIGIAVIIGIIAVAGVSSMGGAPLETVPTVNLEDSVAVSEDSGKSFDIGIDEGLKIGDKP